MKRKFTALILCLLMVVTCALAGCATFSIDKVKYYNEVLATVGDTSITRHELLIAYNNYGYNYYVSQMGKTEEEALEETLNLLIDRETLYQYAVKNNDNKPTKYQVNEIVKSMFDSLDSSMDSFVKTSKEILNIKVEEKTEDSSEDKAYKYEDYLYTNKKRANLVEKDGVYSIEYINKAEPANYEKLIDEEYLADFSKDGIVNEIKTAYLLHFKNNLTTNEGENAEAIYNKSISLFAKSLINYEHYLRDENNKSFSLDTNDLIFRYFDRTLTSQIKSQYLTNLQNNYLKDEAKTFSVTNLIEEYNYLYNVNKDTYSNETTYKDKMKNIGTDGNSVLYHPETLNDGTQFGYFIHILFKFNDDQTSDIKNVEKIKDIDLETYNKDYKDIIGKTEANKRNEDGIADETFLLNSTKNDFITRYNNIKTIENYNEKLDAFVDLMFDYTEDTATLNAGSPYVVGTNGYSAMETAFTDEAIKLMQSGNVGAMSNFDANDINSMCITSYGIHMLFYVGNVNAYDLSDMTASLLNEKINPLTKETYFDYMFDLLYPANSNDVYTSNTGYSDYENAIIENNKGNVTRFDTKIKATKTDI